MIFNNLDKEVSTILNFGNKYKFPDIKIYLHTEDGDYELSRVMHLDIKEDYSNSLMPEIVVEFVTKPSFYRDVIYKNKDKMEITIIRDWGIKKIINRYRALIMNTDTVSDDSKIDNADNRKLDTQTLFNVKIQCIDPLVPGFKVLICSGVYRDTDLETLVKSLYAKHLSELKIGGLDLKYKLFVYPFNNKSKYDDIIIPETTKLVKLPYLLQYGQYGVYNGGIGLYVSKDEDNYSVINIFPNLDYTMFDKYKYNKLVILNPSKTNLSLNEVAYYKYSKKSNLIKMIAQEIKIENKLNKKKANLGNTLYIKNPYTLIDPNNKVITEEKKTMTVFLKKIVKKDVLKDNAELFDLINTNLDFNIFKYRTLFLQAHSVAATLSFNNIYDYIFHPGMPIRYYYLKKGKIYYRDGVLQGYFSTYNINKKENRVILSVIFDEVSKEY